ncbi:hypothetical protein K469DRAFT_597534, partial [Zopfia rhizophila CBS 207.26]
ARVRRRARIREGPPQLQFVTATDPSQFKEENTKRSVRSQAMIQYRYKADQQRRKGKGAVESRNPDRPPLAERVTPVMMNDQSYQDHPNALMAQLLDERQEQEHIYPTTAAAWRGTNPEDTSEFNYWFTSTPGFQEQPLQSSRYQRALSIVPLNAAAQFVTDYHNSESHEEALMRILCSKLAAVRELGDRADLFSVLPQFSSPELNTIYLVRRSNRLFVSQSTMAKWIPTMLAHPHSLLSGTVLASTYLDMNAGFSGDSKRTALVKTEVIGFINERLRNPATQFEDLTLMVILHLLAGEMWSANEKTLRIHESGVARLIYQRGGMHSLGVNGAIAEVAAVCCYQTDIVCEAMSLPLFYNYKPSRFTPIDEMTAIPESPLFCPRSEFFTIIHNFRCSKYTYELLCDMRDLTDLFLSYHADMDRVHDIEAGDRVPPSGLTLAEYETKVAGIRARLEALSSAYTPGLLVSNDWVYESCRIAALIYTSAIILRVPFSIVSEPGNSTFLRDTGILGNSFVGGHQTSTRLVDVLYQTLEKADLSDVWDSMSGVLYWAAAVGAAAARTPASINMSQTPKTRNEAYATWVRRCLIMFATRAMILLVFEHPLPILAAQKRLLRVQELIASGRSRRLVS